jgi:hypothetical protein
MTPGTWERLDTIGLTNEYFQFPGGNGHESTEFMHQAVWDSKGRKVLFVGAGHFNTGMLHIYEESTNTWGKGALPGTTSHANASNAINVAGRVLGYSDHSPSKVTQLLYHIDTDTWETKAQGVNGGSPAHGQAYFPERDRWYFVDGTKAKLREYNAHTDTWSEFLTNSDCFRAPGSGDSDTGYLHDWINYSPAQKEVMWGGGVAGQKYKSRSSCRMDADGTVTVNPVAPTTLLSTSSRMVNDPVTGDLLVLTEFGEFYALNRETQEWGLIPPDATMPPEMQEEERNLSKGFVVPIDTYGVVMVLDYKSNNQTLWLYKHAQGDYSGGTGGTGGTGGEAGSSSGGGGDSDGTRDSDGTSDSDTEPGSESNGESDGDDDSSTGSSHPETGEDEASAGCGCASSPALGHRLVPWVLLVLGQIRKRTGPRRGEQTTC